MPEEVEDCVDSVMADGHDESSAYAICYAQQKAEEYGVHDTDAFASVAARKSTGSWQGVHPAEKTADGREHLMDKFGSRAEKAVESMEDRSEVTEKSEFTLKAAGPQQIFKVNDDGEDRFVVWGPASVEVVDKENDKITAKALKGALPQLLRRKRVSLKHSDQLVGDILDEFETEESVTVKFNGHEVTRSHFPTDVLKLDGMEPALYVASEIYDDSRQAKQAREDIEAGELDSYSISGEAITTSTKVKDGEVYDEITELDLSAVTLCDEGMNSKAKFGTVTKIGYSDDPHPAQGTASVSRVAVTKTASDDNVMTDTEDGETETIKREDLRAELKEAASQALDEASFATKDEVESMIEEKLAAGDDEEEEKAPEDAEPPEDLEDPDDEESEADDDDVPPETPDDDLPDETEEKGPEAIRAAAEEVAAEYEHVGADELEATLASAVEGADDDADVGADDAAEVETTDDSYTDEELERSLPDDLYEAVKEHVGDEDEPDVEEPPEAPEVEDEEEDEEEVVETSDDKSDADGPDLDKMDDSEYLSTTVTTPIDDDFDDGSMSKSYDGDEDRDIDDTTSALEMFYESQGETA